MKNRLLPLLVAAMLLAVGVPLIAENRQALLIANSHYQSVGSLGTPIQEAHELKVVLERLNFQVVLLEDASREAMLDGLDALGQRLQGPDSLAFFHYGGHGVQAAGHNYLIPVDADLPDERKLATRAVDLDEVMSTLEASQATTSIVILDACRNNPLPAASRTLTRGLASVTSKPRNSVIVYSAEANASAQDGLFTPALTAALDHPGWSLLDVLAEVRRLVFARSQGTQVPGEYNQLFAPVFLAAGAPRPSLSGSGGTLTLVEGKRFVMGDSAGTGDADEKPTHQVTVSPFWMANKEVSQELWISVMKVNLSQEHDPSAAVNQLTWREALQFCNKLSEREGLESAYDLSGKTAEWNRQAAGYRLPTEAEWEAAGRFGSQWVWCWDYYAPYSAAAVTNPAGPLTGQTRVIRGGSATMEPATLRVTNRGFSAPERRDPLVGLWLVRNGSSSVP